MGLDCISGQPPLLPYEKITAEEALFQMSADGLPTGIYEIEELAGSINAGVLWFTAEDQHRKTFGRIVPYDSDFDTTIPVNLDPSTVMEAHQFEIPDIAKFFSQLCRKEKEGTLSIYPEERRLRDSFIEYGILSLSGECNYKAGDSLIKALLTFGWSEPVRQLHGSSYFVTREDQAKKTIAELKVFGKWKEADAFTEEEIPRSEEEMCVPYGEMLLEEDRLKALLEADGLTEWSPSAQWAMIMNNGFSHEGYHAATLFREDPFFSLNAMIYAKVQSFPENVRNALTHTMYWYGYCKDDYNDYCLSPLYREYTAFIFTSSHDENALARRTWQQRRFEAYEECKANMGNTELCQGKLMYEPDQPDPLTPWVNDLLASFPELDGLREKDVFEPALFPTLRTYIDIESQKQK